MSFLIAIEGIDGSGKGTQARQLVDRLTSNGISNALLSFPRYSDTLFGAAIGQFLNGDFGPLENVAPQLAATLYAVDRFESRDTLLEAMANHQVVVCDRYVPSNLAHQGSRAAEAGQDDLITWIEHVEYDVFNLPRPDAVIWLDVPPQVSRQLIEKKAPRDYTDKAADLQEADFEYQLGVHQVYQSLASSRSHWNRIDGLLEGTLQVRPIEDIADDVLDIVSQRI
ncbi:MAG TPA: dTMP kinase [Planctomycetaceae bacterium]|mgnify:CR=1 FL=1|nr:dTMP kinase [Planctomycetaceae bacterium]|tara:strand:- start:7275 stop:7949 length:675 start_codon:yes stop_codon:yes gene_type:complete